MDFDDFNFNMSHHKNTRKNWYEVKDIEDKFIFLKLIFLDDESSTVVSKDCNLSPSLSPFSTF